MSKTNIIIGGAIVALLLGIGVLGGWSLHKSFRPCPIITTDTVTIYDTTTYTIYDSILVHKVDTIWVPGDTVVIPADIDTATIIKNYFSIIDYTWSKQDTNIRFDLTTRVTQNRPIKYEFSYNLLKPVVTVINEIDNSQIYNRYVYFGLDVPIKNIRYLELEATYNWEKGYLGIGYTPELKSINAKAGVPLIKFKKVK